MDTAPILYNEFPLFLKRYFPYKVRRRYRSMPVLPVPIETVQRDMVVVLTATTKLSILSIAVRKSPLLSNWKKEKYSLPISILR